MNVHPLRAVADAEFRTLEEDGFVQLHGMLDEDWIERMRRATEAMLDRPGPAGGGFQRGWAERPHGLRQGHVALQ